MTPPFVLIVEDNPITQETLTRDLGALDLQTHAVPSAEEAWDYLGRATPPDVIILDFHLPGEDGSSLYRRVNSDPRFGKTAIIPFTALADMSNNSQEAILTLQRGLDAAPGRTARGFCPKGGTRKCGCCRGPCCWPSPTACERRDGGARRSSWRRFGIT
jgi:CheY-like chemotaxis protein